jgi:hypothetical protein
MSIAILLFNCSAQAATYYVDPGNGNDADAGDSTHPWKTIGHAMITVKAGDTVKLRSGSYGPVNFNNTSNYGTSWSLPITYTADTGHTPTFTGITTTLNNADRNWYLIFDGLTISTGAVKRANGFYHSAGSCIKIRNCNITGNYTKNENYLQAGVGVCIDPNSHYDYNEIEVDSCEIKYFITGISASNNPRTGLVFHNNNIHNVTGSGIKLGHSLTHPDNDEILITNNRIHDHNEGWKTIEVMGTINGTFSPAGNSGEPVVQAITGATGYARSQGPGYVRFEPNGPKDFETGAGKTITGRISRATLSDPSSIKVQDSEHSSGLSLRVRHVTAKNNIIHSFGGTNPICTYQSVFDGLNGCASGGYSDMNFINNLVYDSRNSTCVAIQDAGNNFNFINNTIIGYHSTRNGREYFETAMTVSFAPGVKSGMTIANNVMVGIFGCNAAYATMKKNIFYSVYDKGTSTWLFYLASNTIYHRGSGQSGHAANFEKSNEFFIGGSLFNAYSYTHPNGNTHGVDLGRSYALAPSSPAIGYADSNYSPTTDIEGNARDASPDAGAYEFHTN